VCDLGTRKQKHCIIEAVLSIFHIDRSLFNDRELGGFFLYFGLFMFMLLYLFHVDADAHDSLIQTRHDACTYLYSQQR
jgi:hypothetical protein